MRQFLPAAALAAVAATAAAQPLSGSAANIHADIAFLASDLLKGREAGSVEYDIAANYVAAQMEQAGLKPGAGKSYFQKVPLVAYRARDPGSLAVTDRAGHVTPLVFGKDYVVSGSPLGATLKADAPLVFAGFGIVAPEHGRDDYKGLDVKGKIVVVLYGAPKSYQTEERAYYTSSEVKRAFAQAHGAVGYIAISTLTLEKLYPLADFARQYQSWAMTWRDARGKPFLRSTLPGYGLVSPAAAGKLLAGAPVAAQKVLLAAETPEGNVPRFELPSRLRAELHSEQKNAESRNVVGILPGADPKLKNEYVVLSAHLDHIGITPPVKGDAINNGALDNGAGVATTLEAARLFAASHRAPRRSVLFLIDTAEEKGLVGADYFAHNPTVPLSAIASDVDLDMPVLLYDFTDVTAFGADRSSIGPSVARAAARMKIKLSPDPMPDEGVFTRSDHYRFVQVGVPAVFLATGFANGGAKAWKDFLANHYHKPSDDLSLPIRYDAGAKFARLNYEIARELADADARPSWNKGDFFGGKYARP